MVAAGRTIASHLEGILNAAVSGLSNAVAEGLNSRIQTLKQRACGYRNVRFRPLRVASVPAPLQASPATPGVCGGDHGHHRVSSA